jgi:hypothetical protein
VTELSQACEAVQSSSTRVEGHAYFSTCILRNFVYLTAIDVTLQTQTYYCRGNPTAQREITCSCTLLNIHHIEKYLK